MTLCQELNLEISKSYAIRLYSPAPSWDTSPDNLKATTSVATDSEGQLFVNLTPTSGDDYYSVTFTTVNSPHTPTLVLFTVPSVGPDGGGYWTISTDLALQGGRNVIETGFYELSIGSVTTLDNGEDATAVIDGNFPNQVLTLGLPRGDQGVKGDTGAAGSNGTNGTNGTDGTDGTDGAPGVVQSIVAGTNVTVDDTDPANPIVSASGGGSGGGIPVYNVLDYGLVSDDNFTSTDNSPALATLLDTVAAAISPAIIYFPGCALGDAYYFKSNVAIPDCQADVTFLGDGVKSLIATSGNFDTGDTSLFSAGHQNCRFEGLNFSGVSSSSTISNTYFAIDDANGNAAYNLEIVNCNFNRMKVFGCASGFATFARYLLSGLLVERSIDDASIQFGLSNAQTNYGVEIVRSSFTDDDTFTTSIINIDESSYNPTPRPGVLIQMNSFMFTVQSIDGSDASMAIIANAGLANQYPA